MIFRNHDMYAVRFKTHSDLFTDLRCFGGLDHHLILSALHSDLIMNALEDNSGNLTCYCSL